MAEWVSTIIGILGIAGLIFTALKYNRDDSSALIQQQSAIVLDMTAINGELRLQLEECKKRLDGS